MRGVELVNAVLCGNFFIRRTNWLVIQVGVVQAKQLCLGTQ
jgi:hypothetical protein